MTRVLDGSELRYFFINEGKLLLATAHVDESGKVTGYRQSALPEHFAGIEGVNFVKDSNGTMALKVREPGRKWKKFHFNSAGEAVSVAAE